VAFILLKNELLINNDLITPLTFPTVPFVLEVRALKLEDKIFTSTADDVSSDDVRRAELLLNVRVFTIIW
jgi:hypothetical protein